MEIIIGLIVLVGLGYFILRPKKVEVAEAVPYKVETPAPVVEEAPAPTPAPVVEEAPAKKTRKPRAPKAEVVVKEKAPAKAKAPRKTAEKAPVVKKPRAPRSKKA
jgi:translation initiation factor IF-2